MFPTTRIFIFLILIAMFSCDKNIIVNNVEKQVFDFSPMSFGSEWIYNHMIQHSYWQADTGLLKVNITNIQLKGDTTLYFLHLKDSVYNKINNQFSIIDTFQIITKLLDSSYCKIDKGIYSMFFIFNDIAANKLKKAYYLNDSLLEYDTINQWQNQLSCGESWLKRKYIQNIGMIYYESNLSYYCSPPENDLEILMLRSFRNYSDTITY